MQKTAFILLGIAVLCLVGVAIVLKINQTQANIKRTEKARATELERRERNRQNKEQEMQQPVQKELFSSADVETIQNN